MVNVSSIILAGGRSTRMGQDKALITIRGQTLLQKTFSLVSMYVKNVYIVTPWPEKYRSILPSSCQFITEVYLVPGQTNGPLVGFTQGLTQINTDWVLLLACDLPGLKAETIASWLKLLPQTPAQAIALLPKTSLGWEPLIGFYRRDCLPLLQQFITEGGRSFQLWLHNQEVAELVVSNPQLLFNCNTPDDLHQFNDYLTKES